MHVRHPTTSWTFCPTSSLANQKHHDVFCDLANAEDIVSYCREHLAAYKVPRVVQFVDDLPKTSTGKVMRRELKTLD